MLHYYHRPNRFAHPHQKLPSTEGALAPLPLALARAPLPARLPAQSPLRAAPCGPFCAADSLTNARPVSPCPRCAVLYAAAECTPHSAHRTDARTPPARARPQVPLRAPAAISAGMCTHAGATDGRCSGVSATPCALLRCAPVPSLPRLLLPSLLLSFSCRAPHAPASSIMPLFVLSPCISRSVFLCYKGGV